MPAIKIANPDEFRLLLNDLAQQIVEAAWHWRICSELEAAHCEYTTAFRQSPTFWGLTFTAHEDAALFRLCRVYDSHQQSLSLPNFLETIKTNIIIFDDQAFRERLKGNPFVESLAAEAQKPNPIQLAEDLAFASDNAVVKALQGWRNNLLAHRSPGQALGKINVGDRFRILRTEVGGLIERGLQILNRYSNMFNATHQSAILIGADDFKTTLEAVRKDLDRREKEHREMLVRVAAENPGFLSGQT